MPFEIFLRVREVDYELALTQPFSSLYLIFHVLVLCLYIQDKFHMLQLDDRLTFVSILARDVRKLHSKDIPIVKVQRRHCLVEKAT